MKNTLKKLSDEMDAIKTKMAILRDEYRDKMSEF